MADIQSQLPVKLTDNTNTAAITGSSALKVDVSATGANATAIKVDGSAVTQPVSGTVTANAGTGNFSVNVAQVSGNTVSTAASGIQKVGISDSAGSAIVLGQTTMSASVPVVVASNQGAIPVTFGAASSGIITAYFTSSSIANSSTGTLTYTVTGGTTLYLKQIIAASSGGPCKVVVDYGAGPTVICVLFYSSAFPYVSIEFAQPISIAASTNVNIKITNFAGTAQDVYGTFIGQEI